MKLSLFIMTSALLIATGVWAKPQAFPDGPYKTTCRDAQLIKYQQDWDFTARCLGDGGDWETHYVLLSNSPPPMSNWENINGNLYRARTVPSGPWLKTCSGSRYVSFGSTGLWKLEAKCRKNDGSYEESELFVSPSYQAYNDDGVLRCVNGEKFCMS